ncbi:MAG: class I SAM-dependent methyltransferase [Lachnospiraceae bacterium]|nr:class I SAM-dependent methyltransferase [Lachnospiraceae bacterium]
MNNTLKYYDMNAEKFVEGTVSVDFVATQNKFLDKLPVNASILDFGCGSGRDTKYFLDHGMNVEAIDGSKVLCKMASEYTGIEVKQMIFQELDDIEKYDGIWACSSILHLSKFELLSVLKKMIVALKDNGIIYTSFKYGEFEGNRNDRYFTDFTIDSFKNFIKNVDNISIEEYWVTDDVRPGRETEKWLNLLLRKTNF